MVTHSTFAQGMFFVKKPLTQNITSQQQTKSSTIKSLMKNNTSQTVKYRWNIYKFRPSTEFNSENKCINSRNVQSQNINHLTSGYIQVSEVLKWYNKKLKRCSFDKSCWSSVLGSNPGFNLQNFQVSNHFPPVFAKVFSPLTFQSPFIIQVP